MKICYFYDGEYPWDVRVEKICNSLAKKGIEVCIFSRNKFQKKRFEYCKGIKIFRIPFVKNRFVNNLINTSTFLNPLWSIYLYKLLKREEIDLLIIRDLPISLSGVLISKILKKPSIFDMAEPYPETCRTYFLTVPLQKKIIAFCLKNPYLALLIEKLVLRLVDRVLVVSNESKSRLLKFQVKEEKIIIIGNTPDVERFHPINATYPGIMKKLRHKKVLIFIGNFFPTRGLVLATRAMQNIIKEIPDARLLIIGDGSERKTIQNCIKNLNLQKYVLLAGWIKNSKLPEFIASSDVGILPFLPNRHMNITLANKLFDCMAMGKPVIASDVLPMRRIIMEEDNGLLFQAGNQKSFEAAAIKMLSNSKMMIRLGENGLKATREKYNWQKEEEQLYATINHVFEKS